MRKLVEKEVNEMDKDFRPGPVPSLSETEFKKLPLPVQRFIDFTKFRKQGQIRLARLKLRGMFRTGAHSQWMPYTAEQYYNIPLISSLWFARLKGPLGIRFSGVDKYLHGEGNLHLKIANLFTIADARGDEVDQAELVRFISELIWMPAAMAEPFVQWEAIDNISAKASILHHDTKATGVFHFDPDGRINSFNARRYRSAGKYYFMEDWSSAITHYREYGDIILPSEIDMIWILKTGELLYNKTELVSVEYDIPGVF